MRLDRHARERSGDAPATALLRRGRAEPALHGGCAARRSGSRAGAAGAGSACDGRAAEQLGQAPEVGLEHVEHPRRVERGRRMEERDRAARASRRATTSCSTPCTRVIPSRLAGEQLRREVAERRDDLRPDQLDLPEEVALAGLDLLGLRVAVAGRAALEHVRDVDVVARAARCRRAASRAAGRRRRRTGRPACPRGSPAPRRRTSGRRSASPSRTRPAFASSRARSACSRRRARRTASATDRLGRSRPKRALSDSVAATGPAATTAAEPDAGRAAGAGLVLRGARERRTPRTAAATFAVPQSGHAGDSSLRTSSSKCDSQLMQTYS